MGRLCRFVSSKELDLGVRAFPVQSNQSNQEAAILYSSLFFLSASD
uniref:Uncharacterized protein n=1 Tax=Arundo donax TaxID=35708 RepID=A0A0A8YL68_ARUDO